MTEETIGLIEAARRAEKDQALYYRRLAADAEARNEPALAERLHDLHADEQHHLSRLTARLIELGREPGDVAGGRATEALTDDWETTARAREHEEIMRYEALLAASLDDQTHSLVESIVSVERNHAAVLAGKWTLA